MGTACVCRHSCINTAVREGPCGEAGEARRGCAWQGCSRATGSCGTPVGLPGTYCTQEAARRYDDAGEGEAVC